MSKRSSIFFSTITLLFAALLLAACGGEAPAGTAATQTPARETAAVSQATKTPLPPPDEPAPPEESYPPLPEEVSAPAGESYPAEQEGAGEGGMRTFIVDTQASSASYLVDEEFFEDALAKLGINAGDNSVVGTTENVSGQIQINLNDPLKEMGETWITADLSGLKTDQDMRDNWIQENGPRFGLFPEATFTATGVEGLPEDYVEGEEVSFQLHGDLTVRDTTLPVTFDVTAAVEGSTLTGTAETNLLMSDFGIEPPSFARTLTVEDELGIRVVIVARE